MARMKLHWSPKSPFVRKTMIAAHELDLLPRIELVRSVAAMREPNPAIMADNPLSKIPTLVLADGRALFDSLVICEYLNDLVGGPLFPKTGEARWQSLRWHALGNGLLDMLILWRNEREREAPLGPLMAAFEMKTGAVLQRLDGEVAELEDVPFAIGHLTIVCALAYLDYRFDVFGWRKQAPRLAGWFAAMQRRPSVAATVPVDG